MSCAHDSREELFTRPVNGGSWHLKARTPLLHQHVSRIHSELMTSKQKEDLQTRGGAPCHMASEDLSLGAPAPADNRLSPLHCEPSVLDP